jgi:hypothetical protein
MISAEHEQARTGSGPGFLDSVSIDFCDPERDTFGLVTIARRPDAPKATGIGLLFAEGALIEETSTRTDSVPPSWERAEVDGVALAVEAPLEQWRASLGGPRGGFEIEVRAASSPIELSDAAGAEVSRAAGIAGYEQLCEVTGTVKLGAESRPLGGLGRRVHTWGAQDWDLLEGWRCLYAASASRQAITAAAARTAGSAGHGDELRTARLLSGEDEPRSFEDVRISTVYGEDGLPRKAGLELYFSGDEFPHRLTGESLCRTSIPLGQLRLGVSFFRWSLQGTPAFGSYQTLFSR